MMPELFGCDPKKQSSGSDVPNNPGDLLVQGAPTVIPPGFSQHLVEYVRVSLLGTRGSGTYIEQFEGATGYHIRTIPASRRYFNPVGIATGAGLMAVIDRFGGTDVIRITDPKSNAPDAAFDSDGFPVDGFAWDAVEDSLQLDIQQILTTQRIDGVGFVVRGLTILPRGFLLVLLDGGFMVWDVVAQHERNCRVFALPAPFDGFTFNGNPGQYDQRRKDGVYRFAAPANSPEGASCLLIVNYVQGTVDYAIPGKDSPVIGGSLCGEIASIWTATDGVNCDAITRLQFANKSYFGSGALSHKTLPSPREATIDSTFDVFDESAQPGFLDFVNRGPGNPVYAPDEESTASGGAGRPLDPTSTTALNRGRTSVAGVVDSSLPSSQNVRLNVQTVATSTSDLVRRTAYLHNSVAEMNTLPTNPSNDDVRKPLYLLLHGTHLDFLANGGFVYGCVVPPDESHPNGSVTPVNDGLAPFDIAVDRSTERGRLKEPPDAKFALVDVLTGLALPEDPLKSLGFNVYAGDFACLKTVLQGETGFTRASDTPCSTTFWSAQETADGLHRSYADPSNMPVALASSVRGHDISFPAILTPPATNLTPPLDSPWACFQPRIVPPIRLMAGTAENTWTRHDEDGAFLPAWLDTSLRVAPAIEVNRSSQMHYPPISANTSDPAFDVSCRSGFFFLNWQKQQLDEGVFEIPDSISEALVGPMDVSPAQDDPEVPEAVVFPMAADIRPAFLQPGTGIVPNATLRRAVGFDTNIRSWVGLEVKLERSGEITDGDANWLQSSALENGLGVPVGAGSYPATSEAIICTVQGEPGASPGYAYDYGDTAGDGAVGLWEIDVFFNGRPAKSIATRVTFPEQIQYLAPTEAQNLLSADFFASGASTLGYHKGRVYFSSEIIKTVTVKARLVNYAFQVFRVGWHTISFLHKDAFGGQSFCPGVDPGFFAGSNCEASCCGNVACVSQVLFGNKLFNSDPIRPVVVNVLWEGEVTYSIPDASNPYLQNGMQVGYLTDVFLSFDLNGAMTGWNINLRAGSQGRSPEGTGL